MTIHRHVSDHSLADWVRPDPGDAGKIDVRFAGGVELISGPSAESDDSRSGRFRTRSESSLSNSYTIRCCSLLWRRILSAVPHTPKCSWKRVSMPPNSRKKIAPEHTRENSKCNCGRQSMTIFRRMRHRRWAFQRTPDIGVRNIGEAGTAITAPTAL